MGEGSFLHVLLGKFVGCFGFLLYILNQVELLHKSWKEDSSKGNLPVTKWMAALSANLAMRSSKLAFAKNMEIYFEFLVVAFHFSIDGG